MFPDLRTAGGAIDSARIAEFFELSPDELKTSDQRGSALEKLEEIAANLVRLTGSVKLSRIWLTTPNAELESDSPIEVIREGDADTVADLLEDILLGQPG